MRIAVAIIEDDSAVLRHLAEIIQSSSACSLSGQASNRAQAMALISDDRTDVYLVDLGLPDVDGVDIIAHIKSSCDHAQSMVLTTFGDENHVRRSIRAGATGYLLKDEAKPSLIDKIVSLHQGGSPVSPPVAKILIQQFECSSSQPDSTAVRQAAIDCYQLGRRELEVLALLATGLGNIIIADRLYISTHTVNQHLRSIYRKLNVRSRSMAVHVARQHGIL
jgi:DNA-binding NarL/FixJ family response regulator